MVVTQKRGGWVGWLLAVVTFALLLTPSHCARAADRRDADDLASLLGIGPGSVVAEVGAGKGKLMQIMAEKVGRAGHVYATEIDQTRLLELRGVVSAKNLSNVTVIEASATDSGLESNCCDSIYMTAVYHHLTKPQETDASLYRALRPGGKIAVLDFRPTTLLAPWKVKGVPANRGGHGVPPEIVRQEMTEAGFDLVKTIDPWPRGWPLSNFCEVFTKPRALARCFGTCQIKPSEGYGNAAQNSQLRYIVALVQGHFLREQKGCAPVVELNQKHSTIKISDLTDNLRLFSKPVAAFFVTHWLQKLAIPAHHHLAVQAIHTNLRPPASRLLLDNPITMYISSKSHA